MSKKYLQVGDVFEVIKGYRINVELPKKYLYSNTPHDNDLANTTISVGEVRRPVPGGIGPEIDTMDMFGGFYVVEKTAMSGGGTGHGPHDEYPNGHEVYARKLHVNGTYNEDGRDIRFYQSGCFTCQIDEKIPVLRTMKRIFV